MTSNDQVALTPYQARIHEIIYESDTRAGKIFDLVLVLAIFSSALIVMLDSVKSIRDVYSSSLGFADWFFTALFTVEYLLRIYCIGRPTSYIFSVYGLIDLFAILPSYLSLFFPGTRYLSVIRIFRTLRILRILKLAQYLEEGQLLVEALKASRKRITVFIFAVLLLVIFIGSTIYVIEGEENGFTSIPLSIYWAVVTLTTVGYGDISPKTPLGQAFSVIIMILGYGIIAVPTGIVTSELINSDAGVSNQACPQCSGEGHDPDAVYCKYCGAKL
ncbi:MAG: ion transporter [Candidatus Riflebacteria bacterium]